MLHSYRLSSLNCKYTHFYNLWIRCTIVSSVIVYNYLMRTSCRKYMMMEKYQSLWCRMACFSCLHLPVSIPKITFYSKSKCLVLQTEKMWMLVLIVYHQVGTLNAQIWTGSYGLDLCDLVSAAVHVFCLVIFKIQFKSHLYWCECNYY